MKLKPKIKILHTDNNNNSDDDTKDFTMPGFWSLKKIFLTWPVFLQAWY